MRAHADEIDWRFNGYSFTKSGCGQAKIFAALRAPNNTNPLFKSWIHHWHMWHHVLSTTVEASNGGQWEVDNFITKEYNETHCTWWCWKPVLCRCQFCIHMLYDCLLCSARKLWTKLLLLTMTSAKDLTPALSPGAEPPSTGYILYDWFQYSILHMQKGVWRIYPHCYDCCHGLTLMHAKLKITLVVKLL